MSPLEELKKLLEDLHKPFAGMIEETKKLEVECVCGQNQH